MNDTGEEKRILAVRLPKNLASAVEAKAKQELISTSAYVRRTLAASVKAAPTKEAAL
jgi:hypothetical protein